MVHYQNNDVNNILIQAGEMEICWCGKPGSWWGEKNKHERMMKEMERMIEGEEEESEQADPVCEEKREVIGGSCVPAFPLR